MPGLSPLESELRNKPIPLKVKRVARPRDCSARNRRLISGMHWIARRPVPGFRPTDGAGPETIETIRAVNPFHQSTRMSSLA